MTDGRPSGHVAFLFTDLEGSTRFWEHRPDVMPDVYARHDAILRDSINRQSGVVYKVIGDAFQVAFPTAAGALIAAIEAQQTLSREPWPVSPAPRVRMALHTCDVEPQPDGDYRTPGLNRLGRLLSAADGGQILLSDPIARDLNERLPAGIRLLDLGEHRFRDLSPQRVYQILAPGLSPDHASLRSLTRYRDNLPPQPTAFVGRVDDVQRGLDAVRDPATRILTLLGPGGIGKTRLALEIATRTVDQFADGVWFVPLAAVNDAALVPSAIAGVLGVRESVDQTLLDALIAHLHQREALLVLDNLEQVLGAALDISALIATCSRLTVLATSRAPLAISGEHVFPVPPLDVPEFRYGSTGVSGDMSCLIESDAVRLFVDRVKHVRPAFALDAKNIETVVALCRRLDGLPLAIELAAARTRMLTPAQLLSRLESRLATLTGGPRDRPARQQTLRAAIDWSYDLLDPPARTLLARLGVFRGGASIEATEAVCSSGDGGSLAVDAVFDTIENLVNQSLLDIDDATAMPRVRMLDTIREYALDRLEKSGERDAIVDRHIAHFLALAESAQEPLSGPEQADWLDLLALEHDNLRAALDALEHDSVVQHIQLAGALWFFWWTRGHLSEGRERLQNALGRADLESVPPELLARALNGAGALAEAQGNISQALALHERALAHWERLGNRLGQARALENLGLIELHDRGNPARAKALHEASLSLFQAESERAGTAAALKSLGDVALTEADYTTADALYAEALAMHRELNDLRGVAADLTSLGALAFFRGNLDLAVLRYEECLASWRELGDVQGTAIATGNLGEVLDHVGDRERARKLFEEGLALSRELGDPQGVAFAQSHLARLLRQEGETERAAKLYAEGARICEAIGDVPRFAECMEGLAGTLIDLGEHEHAVRLLGAADRLREDTESPLPEIHGAARQLDLNTSRDALGEARFDASFTQGRAIDRLHIGALIRKMTAQGGQCDWGTGVAFQSLRPQDS
jgi:predicted ATPase/class 3 adenylate cyclase